MNEGNLDIRPGGLDILSTGLNLAELDLHGGDGFWEEVRRYARDSLLEAQVDVAMGGRAAPRIWAFVESPGSGPAAAAAALGAAYLLADRGQAVVLVDADENEPRLTRWLGRTEMEGWIDMVRFGASLHAASDALPSDSRRGSVLGIGSFAPTGVTPDEVGELLGRLRRQADDLVLVLPAKLRSEPWLKTADIRLLCWDLLSRSAADTGKIVVEMERMGAKPDALVGFGVEEFTAIRDHLVEIETRSAEEAETPEPAPEEPDLPDDAAEPEPVFVDPPGAEPAAEKPPKGPRRSSGIFVFAAVAAVVCLGLLGVFLAGQFGGGEDAGSVVVAAVGDTQRTVPVVAGSVDIPAANAPIELQTEAIETPGDGATEDPGTADIQPEVTPEPLVADTSPAAVVPDTAQVEPPAAEPNGMDWAPFRKPAGQDGWALWLTSFPTESDAGDEIRRLESRGIRAAMHAVEIKDRGRWFRVYAGSFPDRAGAKAAVEGLKAELKHDWVVPARF